MANKDQPAFPAPNWYDNTPCGMTLRQYYAGQALMGCLASPDGLTYESANIAKACLIAAEALIAELDK